MELSSKSNEGDDDLSFRDTKPRNDISARKYLDIAILVTALIVAFISVDH